MGRTHQALRSFDQGISSTQGRAWVSPMCRTERGCDRDSAWRFDGKCVPTSTSLAVIVTFIPRISRGRRRSWAFTGSHANPDLALRFMRVRAHPGLRAFQADDAGSIQVGRSHGTSWLSLRERRSLFQHLSVDRADIARTTRSRPVGGSINSNSGGLRSTGHRAGTDTVVLRSSWPDRVPRRQVPLDIRTR
jgi:hypothetical protein